MENTSKPVIGIAQVLQMLKEGKTREEIRVHYGLNKTNLGLLFKHPQLIGKKTIKQKEAAFTIVEDEAVALAEFEVVDTENISLVKNETEADDNNEEEEEEGKEEEEEEGEQKSTWT